MSFVFFRLLSFFLSWLQHYWISEVLVARKARLLWYMRWRSFLGLCLFSQYWSLLRIGIICLGISKISSLRQLIFVELIFTILAAIVIKRFDGNFLGHWLLRWLLIDELGRSHVSVIIVWFVIHSLLRWYDGEWGDSALSWSLRYSVTGETSSWNVFLGLVYELDTCATWDNMSYVNRYCSWALRFIWWLARSFLSKLLQLASMTLDLERLEWILSICYFIRLSRCSLLRFNRWWIASLGCVISHTVVVNLWSLRLHKAYIWVLSIAWVDKPISFDRINLILDWVETLPCSTWIVYLLAVPHTSSMFCVIFGIFIWW